MSLGQNIRTNREMKGITQTELAKSLGVSYQAVSGWEKDTFAPDTHNLIKLASALDVSISVLVEDRIEPFRVKDHIYNWEHMKTYVKTTAKDNDMPNTLSALNYAVKAHRGQKRKNTNIPYIYHPLNMACHALSMDILDDEIIAGILLHDVVEDCGKTLEEPPVNDGTKEIVRLMTREKTDPEKRETVLREYYRNISKDPRASLVKCIDRCNNLTNMSLALSREKIYRVIRETEKYYPALIATVKSVPGYSNAAWLLKYQMESMLDIYKRLL